ncbi:MAG TPA: hypothetical protein VMY77_16620 [Chitinophagaceae bacterium]|nr:hypothetical protein [Chitinophagaceae bacterium]
MLNDFLVDAKDRQYQFWKRNPLSIDIRTEEVFIQKLNYIPVRMALAGRT